jgi:hypothetical protein
MTRSSPVPTLPSVHFGERVVVESGGNDRIPSRQSRPNESRPQLERWRLGRIPSRPNPVPRFPIAVRCRSMATKVPAGSASSIPMRPARLSADQTSAAFASGGLPAIGGCRGQRVDLPWRRGRRRTAIGTGIGDPKFHFATDGQITKISFANPLSSTAGSPTWSGTPKGVRSF